MPRVLKNEGPTTERRSVHKGHKDRGEEKSAQKSDSATPSINKVKETTKKKYFQGGPRTMNTTKDKQKGQNDTIKKGQNNAIVKGHT